ncbi:NmrA family NAD(P)-binding protein [Yinghuangia sp. YIM S09857]|uniref:NmrA family NAD(P)-binding protein n=1 Tax=Yinghuangia sp. YIM S09857 TaxID=3436929 RepID=UPI003F533F38
MNTSPILILGGTGKTGRHVAESVARRGHPVRAVSRSTSPRFDWHDRDTWKEALAGAAAVYLVEPEQPVPLGEFSALAVEMGVVRQVLLSARSRDDVHVEMKAASEAAVRESGAEWTLLRPAWFHQNFTEFPLFSGPLAAGELRLPTGGGREPFIDARDIAEVAAEALTAPGHAGRAYELTGPESLTFTEAVDQFGAAFGVRPRFRPVTEDEYAAELRGVGVPEEFVGVLVSLFQVIREGVSEGETDDVREVLGREPRSFAAWAAEAVGGG